MATFPLRPAAAAAVGLSSSLGVAQKPLQYGSLAFEVSPGPSSIAVGDLDGDGSPDLAVCTNGLDTVAVLVNEGNGSFGPQTVYPGGGNLVAIALGRLDGDEHLDVVAADSGSSGLRVFLNNGDGTLAGSVELTLAATPISVTVADVDGDGDLDLLVPSFDTDEIRILRNDGAAIFTADPAITDPLINGPVRVLTGDLDGDGDLDLVAQTVCTAFGCGGGPNVVLLNDGGGGFTVDDAYPGGAIALGDLDGDGDLDGFVAQTVMFGAIVSRLINDGTGVFTNTDLLFVSAVNAGFVATGDLDGNGTIDAVIADYGDFECAAERLHVLLNDGAAVFATPVAHTVGDWPIAIVLADLDQDEDLDVAAANAGDPGSPFGCDMGEVVVLLNGGAARLGAPEHLQVPGSVLGVECGELDGLGGVDLAATDIDGDEVVTWTNDGTGGFGPPRTHAVGAGPFAFSLGQLTGDGDLDGATANLFDDTVSVLAGTGDGGFAPAVNVPVAPRPSSISIGAIDGDAHHDIVCAHNSDSGTISVLVNDGTGIFVPNPPLAVGSFLVDTVIADVDGDGVLDVAVTNGGTGGGVYTLVNDGAASFAVNGPWPTEVFPISIDAGDLDGDGDVDLVAANFNSDSVTVLSNDGAGGFADVVHLAVGEAPRLVRLRDVDGDGDLDLAVANSGEAYASPECHTGSVSILLNTGGLLEPEATYRGGYGPSGLSLADVDDDGRVDLAIGNGVDPKGCFIDHGVTILRNVGAAPCPADTNGDGTVNVTDLTNVVLAWGTADPEADVNGDGIVGVADLTFVILGWGSCAYNSA